MSTSIRRGVEAMPDDAEALVVAVGDQPGLDPGVAQSLIARWRQTGLPIVSASYRGARGHPVLFARPVFPELLELQGDAGARLLIERSPERVSYVEVDAEMPPDVDTTEQLAALETPASATPTAGARRHSEEQYTERRRGLAEASSVDRTRVRRYSCALSLPTAPIRQSCTIPSVRTLENCNAPYRTSTSRAVGDAERGRR